MPSLHNNVSLRGKTKFKNYDDNDCTAKYVNIDKTTPYRRVLCCVYLEFTALKEEETNDWSDDYYDTNDLVYKGITSVMSGIFEGVLHKACDLRAKDNQ